MFDKVCNENVALLNAVCLHLIHEGVSSAEFSCCFVLVWSAMRYEVKSSSILDRFRQHNNSSKDETAHANPKLIL